MRFGRRGVCLIAQVADRVGYLVKDVSWGFITSFSSVVYFASVLALPVSSRITKIMNSHFRFNFNFASCAFELGAAIMLIAKCYGQVLGCTTTVYFLSGFMFIYMRLDSSHPFSSSQSW